MDNDTRVKPVKDGTESGGATVVAPGRSTGTKLRSKTSSAAHTAPTLVGREHQGATETPPERSYPPAGAVVLKERFALLNVLGSGGMGEVYLARDLLREEMGDQASLIALKVLNEHSRQLPGALQALQREAKKAQSLSHPNIVTVYDFDRDGETAFITMEYIEGESLKDHLRRVQRMPPQQAMYVIERVARGLAYAHQQGFAHADIKPANVFVAENGSVKILDFGIAKAFKEVEGERSLGEALTEGALTPAYASPQMLAGRKPQPCDDVYALACMGYEMLAGHHPFRDAHGQPIPADRAASQGKKPVPIAGVPRRTMRAVCRGLCFDDRLRFADAGAFIDAIKARNWKKDLALLSSAVAMTAAVLLAADAVRDRVVPGTDALKAELAEVAQLINEADTLLEAGDLDMAHRLYSQAWELSSDLTASDLPEREKAHAIIRDRATQLSDRLIARAQASEADEYVLRELYVALDFLHKDEIPGNDDAIKDALLDLDLRLKNFNKSAP